MTHHDPFQIGAPWPAFIQKDKEGHFYCYIEGNHLLVLSEAQISQSRINAVQHNRVELALFVQEHILFLCHHFHGFSAWGDIPYNWHLFGDAYTHAVPPEVAPGEYISLLVVLVDGASDRIVARRGLRLPPKFGKTLHDALRAQAMEPFSYGRFHLQVLHMHHEFPTPEDLLTKAQASCVFDAITTQHDRHN